MKSRTRILAGLLLAACLALGAFTGIASAAAPAWQTVAATGPTVMPPVQSEVQRLAVDAEGGTFTLTFSSQTTAALSFDATPSQVEAALNGLSTVGGAGGSVTVTGGIGGPEAKNPYSIAFGGSLANLDVAVITTDATALTGAGHSATISVPVNGGAGTTKLATYALNVGGYESQGSVSLKVKLPTGVTTTATPTGTGWSCSAGAGQNEYTCNFTDPTQKVPPSTFVQPVNATITAAPGTPDGVITYEYTGGEALPASDELPLKISPTPAPPGIQSFTAGAYDSNGNLDTQAGGHPYSAATAILANTLRTPMGALAPVGEFKDIMVDLPPGFLGNPIAVPQCPETIAELKCPFPTMVGVSLPLLAFGASRGILETGESAVFNTEAPYGYPGKFRFNVLTLVPLNAVGDLRSDTDYGLTVSSLNTPQIKPVFGAFFSFWGAPAEASHDSMRCNRELFSTKCGPAAEGDPVAFLTNSTNCAEQAVTPPVTLLNATLWQQPGQVFSRSVPIPSVTGCDKLKFEADFTFEPSDTRSDSPASFRTTLTVPSEGLTNPSKLTTPELKKTVVQLPKGVVLNASGADGLEGCSLDQIGYLGGNFAMPSPIRFNRQPNRCPEASKIGTGELKTALIDETLHGALYLAAQGNGNPFGSLFAIYLVIEDPRHGIFIKLPGRVDPSEQDGQMTITFDNLPQVPFTRLDLNLKGGDRSALASPTTCGNYVTTATNTPWSAPESGPPTVSANGFAINRGPDGQPCANTPQERPFDLGWQAGGEKTAAGADGPFSFRITRPDGAQEIDTLELRTPIGLSASLKGIPYCPEAAIAAIASRTGKEEQSNPSCAAASQVGTVLTAAGSGPRPFYTAGKLYLAGPYKGAPFSVLAVTPAVAGPFDLGNVVVRSAAFIDRSTAQVTAKTDPIPQILKGVALRIKDVRITLDRDKWTINPTSCDPSSVKLVAQGNSGATVERTTGFQVAGCQGLAFKPTLKAHLTGGTLRGDHPAFTATVSFPAGHANTKDVQVTIPHSEFLEQAHINTICTRAQAAAKACPRGSIYGFAEAETPLIDGKLTGPVFLKSSNHTLPDLAIALRGPDSQPIEVEFAGRIDSVKGQIRNTIEGLPDVPVTKFVLRMKGGRKGLLANSRNLCRNKVTRMTVQMVGHNNKAARSRPPLTRKCGGKGKGKAKRQATQQRAVRLLAPAW